MADFAKPRLTMVDTQVRPSDVTNFPIIDAMLSVPREEYVPAALRELAYIGGPLELASGTNPELLVPDLGEQAAGIEATQPRV